MVKTVLSEDAITVGKIGDMVIEPKECIINQILVSTGGAFSKKRLIIADVDIKHIGDYIILKVSNKDLENKIVD